MNLNPVMLTVNQLMIVMVIFHVIHTLLYIVAISPTTSTSTPFQEPLFDGSAINTDTSWCTIMYCAIKNKLPYTVLESILGLVQLHCPVPNQIPTSLYKLKTRFNYLLHGCSYFKYCNNCMAQIEQHCSNAACARVKATKSYLAILPIKDRLKELFLTTRCKMHVFNLSFVYTHVNVC